MNSDRIQRRTGLQRSQRPSGLLKNIDGRRKDGVDLGEQNASTRLQAEGTTVTTMPHFMDEEDEDYLARPPDSSDEEDDRHKNADINPTFGAHAKLIPLSSENIIKSGDGKKEPLKAKNANGSRQSDVQSIPTPPKRSADSISGGHLKDSIGFMKKVKVSKTFGKATQKATAKGTMNSTVASGASPIKSRFKIHGAIDSNSFVKDKGRSNTFEDNISRSSPLNSPVRRAFDTTATLSESPEKPRKDFVKPHLTSPGELSQPKRFNRSQNARQARGKGKSAREEAEEGGEEPTSPLRTFKSHIFDGLKDLEDPPVDSSKPVLSTQQVERMLDPQGTALNSESDLSSLDDAEFDPEPRCPMCDELVDPGLFEQYTAKGRMSIKNQTSFCRLHKRKDAENVRSSKGYPKVDWTILESRFSKHEERLGRILEGEQSSHYADRLMEHVEAGKNRTLLRTEENLTPGYYGPRGLRVMADYIVERFSETLRKRTIEDHLISSRGYSGYVQAVLVPELAVHLIMDDMHISESEARKVMLESSDLGELVHEETRDVVLQGDGEDD